MNLVSRLRRRCFDAGRRILEYQARRSLRSRRELWDALSTYIAQSGSTGCGYADYLTLYRIVRARKPRAILECGTGVSTIVLAHALAENARDGAPGQLTTVEELEEYYLMSRRLLPGYLAPFVEFVHSPRVEDCYLFFRGVRYRDVPDRPYDFVFVDGPNYVTPSDGSITFDFDFIHVLERTDTPVFGVVDKRLTTCFVLQQLLGKHKVRYSPLYQLGFIGPASRQDLKGFDPKAPSRAFEQSLRLLARTELKLSF